jgi:phenylalanyl-tRNA synthetase alpha chain
MNAQEIQGWVNAAASAFSSATNLEELKSARLLHSGDKSAIAGASRNLGSLSPDEKASLGKVIGDAKAAIAIALAQATKRLEVARSEDACRRSSGHNVAGTQISPRWFTPN